MYVKGLEKYNKLMYDIFTKQKIDNHISVCKRCKHYKKNKCNRRSIITNKKCVCWMAEEY